MALCYDHIKIAQYLSYDPLEISCPSVEGHICLYSRSLLTLCYDSVQFPHFCGKSATFSMWIENWDDGARSTLISRYVNGTNKSQKYSIYSQ